MSDGRRPQAGNYGYRSGNGSRYFLLASYNAGNGRYLSPGNSSGRIWEHRQASCQTRSAHVPDPYHNRYAGRTRLFSGSHFSSYPEWKQYAGSGGCRIQNVLSLCGRQLSAVCGSVFLPAGAGIRRECTLEGLLPGGQCWRWRLLPDSDPVLECSPLVLHIFLSQCTPPDTHRFFQSPLPHRTMQSGSPITRPAFRGSNGAALPGQPIHALA